MRTAVEKALEELVDVVPAGVDGFYYQGQELKDKKCKEVEAFKGIDTLHKLYAVLRNPGVPVLHISHVRANGFQRTLLMVSVQLLQHWYMICLVEVFIE